MQFNFLLEQINMPEEVTIQLLKLEQEIDFSSMKQQMDQLQSPDKWDESVALLRELLAPDPVGYKMLTVMLTACLDSYKQYQELGISDSIFFDTIAAFARFVKEHMVSFGYFGFDRDFWTPRQIALKLFRIGELEYEMVIHEEKHVISIHIPSDGRITRENCKKSFCDALLFFEQYLPEWKGEVYVCDSWLLSPNLKEVLPETSHILEFQSFFIIVKTNPEDQGYMEWVYKSSKLPLSKVPQDTSLQRNIKAHLLNGGKIGSAAGYLRHEAFIE